MHHDGVTETPSQAMRLHRRIAQSGICSRRAAEELIAQGRVRVNGQVVREMGVKVGPGDEIDVDGDLLPRSEPVTIVMNKPSGYLTTMSDPRGRPTIVRLLPRLASPVKPVGRLDMDTEGILILTSDGDLAHRLSHPRHEIEKEYEALVNGIPDERALERLRRGVRLEDGMTAPAVVEIIGRPAKQESTPTTKLKLVIHEGRNRQVRRMCEAVGHPVLTLKRVRVGFLGVKGLRKGECRILGMAEVDRLKKMVGLG